MSKFASFNRNEKAFSDITLMYNDDLQFRLEEARLLTIPFQVEIRRGSSRDGRDSSRGSKRDNSSAETAKMKMKTTKQ